jgi:hypothetical protein
MKETIPVALSLPDGVQAVAQVEIRQVLPASLWTLTVREIELNSQTFSGRDLFEAMIELRRALEATGALLLCAGARPEVFPSGMSRGMGGGRKAYVTRLGQPARRADLVDIFEAAEVNAVDTVDAQSDFHARWVESLRR